MEKGKTIKTTEMGIGDSFTGTLVELRDGKYGQTPVFNIGGKETLVFPSGNFKRNVGTLRLGVTYTVTRDMDTVIKGYNTSQFIVAADGGAVATAPAPKAVVNNDIAARIAAAKAKAAGQGN